MAAGFWDVDVPRKGNTMCRICCKAICTTDLRFQWFPEQESNAQMFFHSGCAQKVGNDKRFARVSKMSIRRSLGLTRSQRDELDNICSGAGDGSLANATFTVAQCTNSKAASSASKHTLVASMPLPLPMSKNDSDNLFRIHLESNGSLKLIAKDSNTHNKFASYIESWPEVQKVKGESAWAFAIKDYDVVKNRLTGSMRQEPLPTWAINAWSAAQGLMKPACKKDLVPRYVREIPSSVKKRVGEVLPYQVEAIRFGISRGGRMLCGDEMGLGKSLISLALAYEFMDEWPVLVICPSMLRYLWQEQILHWLGHVVKEEEIDMVLDSNDSLSKKAKFAIVPYSQMSKVAFQKTGAGKAFKVVICDESHFLKEHASQRTQACLPVLQGAERVILLSGTPSPNNPTELHTQLQAILGEPAGTFLEFANRYCHRKSLRVSRRKYVDKWQGAKREDELGILLRGVMIRRLKDEVMEQLPEKRRQRIVILAEDEISQSKVDLLPDRSLDDFDHGRLSDAFQKLCKHKLKSTQQYVEGLLDGLNSKALLFAHHHDMLDGIERVLRAKKIKFIRIDGKTPMAKRSKHIREFQNDETISCALLSITACSVGVDLSSANLVVFCELYWVPGIMEQCESRAHRKGQKRMVDVQYLVVKGSIDDAAYRTLCSKRATNVAILDRNLDRSLADSVTRKRPAGTAQPMSDASKKPKIY